MSITSALEKARQDLIDLGFRNPLINYRGSRNKGLEIIDERAQEVYKILVVNGKAMDFSHNPAKDDQKMELSFGDEISFDPTWYRPGLKDVRVYILLKYVVVEAVVESLEQPEARQFRDDDGRFTDTHLQTDYSSKELQRRLIETADVARTMIEEQGVNILFLTLGELRWYESDSSEDFRRAPLVLIPIEINRKNAQARFTVRYTEGGINGNISLREKLRADFGLKLTLPFEEDIDEYAFDLEAYCESVRQVIQLKTRWSVNLDAIHIGFFSFGKFLMYTDLSASAWPQGLEPHNHPIIKAILGDGFDEEFVKVEPLDREQIDDYQSHLKNSHIVDSDSSQTEAIHAVKQGKTLSIQGPPGTGKSQTIANIIAEAVGDGKTVLFVAEKLAALEVVKRRLDAVSVGDVCLELHSHKLNRKFVLAELQRTLDLTPPNTLNAQTDTQEHRDVRHKLNAYSVAVNTKLGDSGVSPYHAYGMLLILKRRLDGIDAPKWRYEGVKVWNSSSHERALNEVQRLATLLKKNQTAISQHSFWGSKLTLITPMMRDDVAQEAQTTLKALHTLNTLSPKLSESMDNLSLNTLSHIETVLRLVDVWDVVRHIPSEDLTSTAWLKRTTQRLDDLLTVGRQYQALWEDLNTIVHPDALDTEIAPIRAAVQAGKSFLKRLFGAKTKAELALGKVFKVRPTQGAELQSLDALEATQRLAKQLKDENEFASLVLKDEWRVTKTDWDKVQEVLVTLRHSLDTLTQRHADVGIYEHIGRWTVNAQVRELCAQLCQESLKAQNGLDSLVKLLSFDETIGFGEQGVPHTPLDTLMGRLQIWVSNTESLNDLVQVNQIEQRFTDLGLNSLFQAIIDWPQAGKYLEDVFELNWYEQIIQRALVERPELREFSGDEHNTKLERFRYQDYRIFQYNQYHIMNKHTQQVGSLSSGVGQVGILKSELARKRGQKSLRKLLAEAANAIQKLKPVFMMSPMSVASFLEPAKISFDLVVFDEASQIRPSDALGAILRGKQIVVVGDTKQMPPTSFFDTFGASNEDDGEEESLSDYESILGLFNSKGIKNFMLRWHYRSRHESLIAVSNQEFYDSKLLIAPSSIAKSDELGLKFRYMSESYYQPGARVNLIEAQAVAQAVMRHAETSPELTLGVAAFSMAQMQAIRDELESLRRQNPEHESFFTRHPNEPFFVKNLENVQGDERDIIFISVGYGKTRDKRLSMNFGPLNKEGGERRLNVLISRARLRCEVFTNLKAEDIDLNRSNAIGIQAFKSFLKYAETGDLDLAQSSGREPDSPFEQAVAENLERLGYRVEYQVGMAGFFIDLAIVDDQRPGAYLVGIECDGATYHRSASARDRDRLRQAILESKGWKILRVWSTDWFNNPNRELEKLKSGIEQAKNAVAKPASSPVQPALPITRQENKFKSPEVAASTITTPYRLAQVTSPHHPTAITEVAKYDLLRLIEAVVNVESPVHIDELVQRVSRALHFERASKTVRKGIVDAIPFLSTVKLRGDFVYLSTQTTFVMRDRSVLGTESRNIRLIAPEEIRAGLLTIVRASLGDVTLQDLVKEVRIGLGFGRTTKEIEQVIEAQIKVLVATNQLIEKQFDLFRLP